MLSLVPPRYRILLRQFIMFGVVGVAGLISDTATVYALRGFVGLYAAGLLAYLSGATTTWALNRLWTFRGMSGGTSLWRQWLTFLGANSLGFFLNRGTYILLVALFPLVDRNPVIATSAGAIAGMFVNFAASKRLVFKH